MVRLSTGRSMLATSNIASDSLLWQLRRFGNTPLSQTMGNPCEQTASPEK